MKTCCLILFVWVAFIANATAEDAGLSDMLRGASACSDASLQDAASRTCDPPEQIAAMAVAKCRQKWDAVATKAMGPSPDASPKERDRSLRIYSAAMEYEYIRVAELKAIDIRTAAGRCGFE